MPSSSPDPEAAVTPPRPRGVAGRRLTDLARRLGAPTPPAGADVTLTGVTLDSRAVRPGDLYAALPGHHAHGADFLAQAVAGGAVAVLTDPDGARRGTAAGGDDLPRVVVPDPRAVLGATASWVYGEPSAGLLLLAVTGTNGKTTTCYLLDAALRAAGHRTGLVGTVETRIGDERVPSVRTTPEAPDLHALFALMREQDVRSCSMEVSSHALALHRVDGVRFDVVAFTNLSQDHLDFHGDLETYYAAKASLFTPERAARGVVCVDDAWGRRLAREAGVPVVTVATTDPADDAPGDGTPGATGSDGGGRDRGPGPDWWAEDLRPGPGGRTAFTLRCRDGRAVAATSPLPGRFNVANTAVAIVVLAEAGIDPATAAAGLQAGDPVPGRMERVDPPAGTTGPLGVVDYAHTPGALEAVLAALRPVTAGRLAVVLGAGGDRDTGKREAMGAAAARGADLVVVTDDNPRSEDPAAIRAALLSGARSAGTTARVMEVADRQEAILSAVRQAPATQDTVLVAGKGHEVGQEVAGQVYPFDDREVLRAALGQVTGC